VQDVPARRNLRQLLHRLRSMLGDAAGQVQMQTDYLQLADDCQTDMQRFLRPVEGADLQDRETQLALYRGDFLQDLTLDDNSPELSAWVATVRQRCRERAVTLALALAAAYVQRDQQELGAAYGPARTGLRSRQPRRAASDDVAVLALRPTTASAGAVSRMGAPAGRRRCLAGARTLLSMNSSPGCR